MGEVTEEPTPALAQYLYVLLSDACGNRQQAYIFLLTNSPELNRSSHTRSNVASRFGRSSSYMVLAPHHQSATSNYTVHGMERPHLHPHLCHK